ncbi:MAG: DUF885 family protein [Caulobacterales bacterium]
MRKALLAIVGVVGVCACSFGDQDASKKKERPTMGAITEEIMREIVSASPETATALGVTTEFAGGAYTSRLDDRSPAGVTGLKAKVDRWVGSLAAFDRKTLTGQDAINYDVIAAQYASLKTAMQFGYGQFSPSGWFAPYVINPIDSAFVTLPDFLDSQHAVKSAVDAEDYLSRLAAVAVAIDQERARFEADVTAGVIPPDFLIDRSLTILNDLVKAAPQDSVYVKSLERRLVALPDVDAQLRDGFLARARGIVTADIDPAQKRLIASLQAVRPRAGHVASASQLPNGAAYYAAALKFHTTTDLTPEQIHNIGLEQVAKITAEMDLILQSQKISSGTVGQRMAILANDPRFVYPNTEDGRAKILAALNAQTKKMQALLPRYFDHLPKGGILIKRVPIYSEESQPGGYYMPAPTDGSRPAAFYINLRDTGAWPSYSLPTLAYHEAIPGHHLQNTLALEAQDLPLLRRWIWFTAYGEGWGLYAEQLADEMGVYANDPFGRLGYLQSQLFRATRLVVDTGMHFYGWSREQAISYMARTTGDNVASVTTEVERYAVWPGQACAYMVGRLEIDRLRDKAMAALGPKFNLKGFHEAVLANGGLPLSALERQVDDWIAKERAR